MADFFWASLSDKLGRKSTYTLFFVVGCLLYLSIPQLADTGNKVLFVGAFCLILSMYGGGFSTVPAYLADLFGTQMVGAIHGRLLTAWATAGILGPVIVNYMREYQMKLGLPSGQVYNQTMLILAGMLLVGMVCNLLVRPVHAKWYMTEAELEAEKLPLQDIILLSESEINDKPALISEVIKVGLAWLAVVLPLGWGVFKTIQSVSRFFL